MGIVLRQSFKNTLVIYLGFFIGGVNTIYLYDKFLTSKYYGLAAYIFSASNLIMPIIAFGIHFTIVKFFSSYSSKIEKDKFLSTVLFLPLLIALPIGFFWDYFHNLIMQYISNSKFSENTIVESYTKYIYIIAVSCAYFELFYSWAKVQMQSVFGNILKELYNRVATMLMLFAVATDIITKEEFLVAMTFSYILRVFLMMFYAFKLYTPKFSFALPSNFSEVIKYSLYILLAGSAGAIVLDIDKVMIPGKDGFATAAYYSVAVFIGSFIEAPSRAMTQILQPLTSKSINNNDKKDVEDLYRKSSINLLLIGGLFFILVNTNVSELFRIMPSKGYAGGELVVLMISFAKLFNMLLGSNGAIINNSSFYKIALPVGLGMATSVYFLNSYFYYALGLGTNGLALATLLVTLFFGSFKLWFVRHKLNLYPLTSKTVLTIFIILLYYVAFNFWNFDLMEIYIGGFSIAPLLNILLKSLVIVPVYIYTVYKLQISQQFNTLVERFIK